MIITTTLSFTSQVRHKQAEGPLSKMARKGPEKHENGESKKSHSDWYGTGQIDQSRVYDAWFMFVLQHVNVHVVLGLSRVARNREQYVQSATSQIKEPYEAFSLLYCITLLLVLDWHARDSVVDRFDLIL